ncbi:hypothetical protein ISS06_01385 [Patescibacteria group bacterium]|nr:hypothetical protein [Patescibacteria group bacterium]
MIFLSILFIIIFFFFLFVFSSYSWAFFSAAPFVFSFRGEVDRMLKIAKIKPGEKFYDLGSGDGRMVLAAGQQGADSVGFEISFFPFILSKIKCWKYSKNCKIFYKNFWKANLKDADIIYFYLLPKSSSKLRHKFVKELNTGTRIISNAFPIKEWEPTRVFKKQGHPPLYLYQID